MLEAIQIRIIFREVTSDLKTAFSKFSQDSQGKNKERN